MKNRIYKIVAIISKRGITKSITSIERSELTLGEFFDKNF